ncbi:hypothetical protein [Telluribacter humicola]|uniref:hypothetical protein n=1 Tax=Telluribacter humicola TaxID=1720261 RepID=UPI001A96A006|nr:hypothetical protein [Telluribacter humicola]
MKKYLVLFIIVLLVASYSCQQESLKPTCLDCGKQTGTLTDRPGTVTYDSTSSRYLIAMHVPGTIDSMEGGFVCELPEQYRQVGKQVLVSGTLYQTSLSFKGVCCWDHYYCLTLSSISER